MDQFRPFFVLFSSFSHSNINYSFNFNITILISIDGGWGYEPGDGRRSWNHRAMADTQLHVVKFEPVKQEVRDTVILPFTKYESILWFYMTVHTAQKWKWYVTEMSFPGMEVDLWQ